MVLQLNMTAGYSIYANLTNDLKYSVDNGVFVIEASDGTHVYSVDDVLNILYVKDFYSSIDSNAINSGKPVVTFHNHSVEITCGGPANECSVFFSNGDMVMQREFAGSMMIDTSLWPAGVYIVNINNIQTLKIAVK